MNAWNPLVEPAVTLEWGAIFARARQAQRRWAAQTLKERGAHLQKMQAYLVINSEEIAATISISTGKTPIEALAAEVFPCTLACQWYGTKAKKYLVPRKIAPAHLLFIHKRNTLHRIPLGVVGIISPWNYPLSIPFSEILMALIAGNAVLVKTDPNVPEVGEMLDKIIAVGGLPPGLYQRVIAPGPYVSEHFFRHGIDKLFFTGSVAVGKTLLRQAADTLTPVVLELGGKDPMVVLEDANLEKAVNGAMWGAFQNAGQTCAGIERVYVQASIYPEFLERLAAKTRALRHGGEKNANVEVGEITTEKQYLQIEKQMAQALAAGAQIVAQSSAATPSPRCYPATVLSGVTHEMEIMREETFGPILCIMPFQTVEEAVTLANDSNYALTASVWTRNLALGKKLALEIAAGVVTINDHLYTHAMNELPWGGWKQSGMGRSHGQLGLEEMTHAKLVSSDCTPSKRNVYGYPYDAATYQQILSLVGLFGAGSPWEKIKRWGKLLPLLLKKMGTAWRVD